MGNPSKKMVGKNSNLRGIHQNKITHETGGMFYVCVSLNGGTPISHPKMIILSRKKPMVDGETHHLGKHPCVAKAGGLFRPNGLFFGFFCGNSPHTAFINASC